jgi:glyoxylase-like metal-dependent hydrolase (beta-lactamase superfamily II)
VPSLFDAAPGITGIDTLMVGRSKVTSAYLIHAERPALVETGPAACHGELVSALTAIGIGPEDLAHIVVSHIHLDHAGGAGALSRSFPGATVWAHERGAPHLVDPARLVASTVRTYGEQRVAEMFGRTDPVPADRVRALCEGTELDLGDRTLVALDAPGHASHEVFLVDRTTGALFTGDGFGVFLPDVGLLRPATPAPEFDLELAVASIRRVRASLPSSLLFSHFGPVKEVEETCDLAIERLYGWTDAVRRALDAGTPAEEIGRALRAETAEETEAARAAGLDVGRYEFLSSYEMNGAGIVRYLSKLAGRSGNV